MLPRALRRPIRGGEAEGPRGGAEESVIMTRTRAVRRSVAGLALAVTGVLAVTATSPAASAQPTRSAEAEAYVVAPGDRMPGTLTPVRAKSTPATGFVAPRDAAETSRVSNVKSTFVVTYHGFPANAKAAFQRAVDLWAILVKSPVPIRIDATWKSL